MTSKSSPAVLGELKARPSVTAMSNDGTMIAITDGRSTWWIWRERPWWLWCFGAVEVLRLIQWSSSFMSSDGKAPLLTVAQAHAVHARLPLVPPSRLWPFEKRRTHRLAAGIALAVRSGEDHRRSR